MKTSLTTWKNESKPLQGIHGAGFISSNFSLMTWGLLKSSLMTEAGMILLMVQKFPAPVDIVDIDILVFIGVFKNIPGGCLGFLNHQPYHGTLQLPNVRFRIRLDCRGSWWWHWRIFLCRCRRGIYCSGNGEVKKIWNTHRGELKPSWSCILQWIVFKIHGLNIGLGWITNRLQDSTKNSCWYISLDFFVNFTQRHLRFTGGFLIEVLSLKREPKIQSGETNHVKSRWCNMYCLKNVPRSIVICYILWNCTYFSPEYDSPRSWRRSWKTVFRILIETETNMIFVIKHDMLISLRELSFACPHPKKAPHLLLANRTSWWRFFSTCHKPTRPWTFWSSTWIDSNKVLRRNNDPIAGPCRVCLPLVKRWRVEEAVNHSKWRNLKTSGTSSSNFLKHIHPSIHPFIHPRVICFEGPNVNLHILPLMLRRNFQAPQKNFQEPQTNLVPFAWIFFLARRLVEMFGNGSAVSVWKAQVLSFRVQLYRNYKHGSKDGGLGMG